MAGELVLNPIDSRTVDFYGDQILAVLVPIYGQQEIYVPLRPLCEYLGLNWSGQLQRLRRDEVLGPALQSVCVTHTNSAGDPNMICLPLELLPGWLFGISTSRVRNELQPKITQYRRECFKILWRAFQTEALGVVGQREIEHRPATDLVRIREMGLAIAQMAEQQIALEARVSVHDQRLDRAAQVFRAFEQRLDIIQEQLHPSSYITDAQAAEIASLVKAIAQQLSEHDKSKNHYQGVFGELYRRFHVSTYKHVRQEQHAEVLAFLDEWRGSIVRS